VQPSTHKRIIFGALGCGGLLVVLMVGSTLLVNRSGLVPPPSELAVIPVTPAAALDSLSAYDLPSLLALPEPLNLVPEAAAHRVARWRGDRRAAVTFLDTFPAGSWQAHFWRASGGDVVIESLPPGAALPLPDSQPFGHVTLAAARVLLESGDLKGARVAVALALRRASEYERRSDLIAVITGLRLERDALQMLARDSTLSGSAAVRARAGASLVAMDRRLAAVRSVRTLIAAAGASAAGVPALATWARDSTLPLAIRDEMIRGIGFGWVLDPPEVSYGLDTIRPATMRGLAAVAWPRPLVPTVQEATLGSPNMVQRITLSISYRTKRMLDQ
jgi:hypothetical protein